VPSNKYSPASLSSDAVSRSLVALDGCLSLVGARGDVSGHEVPNAWLSLL
jgi:hypothetical protein